MGLIFEFVTGHFSRDKPFVFLMFVKIGCGNELILKGTAQSSETTLRKLQGKRSIKAPPGPKKVL